jgi:hypothetical protein
MDDLIRLRGYVPTGLLDERRAIRPLPDRTWPEARHLVRIVWRWPTFTIWHRPYDWRID